VEQKSKIKGKNYWDSEDVVKWTEYCSTEGIRKGFWIWKCGRTDPNIQSIYTNKLDLMRRKME
jgi:hypothetical protein